MKFASSVSVCLFFFLTLMFSPLCAKDESNLNGLLKGQYGYLERLTCVMAKAGPGGMHAPLPHFAEVSPGVYQLLVDGVSTTIVNQGIAEFDGISEVRTFGSGMSLNSSAVNVGDVVNQPFPPADCLGTYQVSTDREFTVQNANCTQQIPGEPPMVGEVGPFDYSGYVSPDGKTLIMSSPGVVKGTNTFKLTDGTVVDQFEGVCVTTQVATKIDSDPAYFAQFANGSGITSEIVLTNPSTGAQATGSVRFLDQDGNDLSIGLEGQSAPVSQVDFTLSPEGSKRIKTDGKGGVKVGSATATSSSPLGGVVRFSLPGIAVSGVNQSASFTDFIFPAQNHTGGVGTGLALQNTGDQPVDIELSLVDPDGQVLATARIKGLAAKGQIAKYITELFIDVDLSDFEGTVVGRVTGGSVAASALELDTQSRTFTTLPVTPLM